MQIKKCENENLKEKLKFETEKIVKFETGKIVKLKPPGEFDNVKIQQW